ncbi:MAG: oligosaccharide flippase family protein, partial [Proteobacteria bacterium]|nr:oligosaccharide flippase family protein [Pseudomonadota bacterium]
QMPTLRREGYRFRPHLRGHPALRRLLVFLGPALIGLATIQVGIVVDLQLAAAFGDGPASWLNYAFRIVQLPMSLFAGAVGVAGLALLSIQVAKKDFDQARSTQSEALSLTSFFVLPSAVGLAVFAWPLVSLLYERGAFTSTDTASTALFLQVYSLGIFAFCLHRVIVPAFYAWHDPWTPMVLSILTVVLKVPLALWLTTATWLGVLGIPLAHVMVVVVEVALMFTLLTRRSGGWSPGFGLAILKMGLAAVIMGEVGWLVFDDWSPFLTTFVAIPVCGLFYLALTHLIGLPYGAKVWARLRR